MSKQLPEVLLFQQDEKALGYKYELSPKNQMPKSIEIKSIDYDVEELINNFELVGGMPKENSVYYLHPYKKNTYVSDSLDANYFLKEKVNMFYRVGQLLGAKSIKTEIKETQSKVINSQGCVKASYILVEGDANVKVDSTKVDINSLKISDKYILEDDFNLNKNIDNLRNFINDNNLNHETDLISLIDARDSRGIGSTLTNRTLESELSSEYNRLLETSLNIKNPVFEVCANFTKNTNVMKVLTIKIDYEF